MSGCCSRSEQASVLSLCSDADKFVELLLLYKRKHTSIARRAVEACLLNFFPHDMVAIRAMMCLLETADEATIWHFAHTQLSPQDIATQSTVSVTVIPNPRASSSWGNTGNFFIVTQKEGQEKKTLHFTNQASAVYYLMFLIHRYNESEGMTPVCLNKNRETFIQLYHQVYDIAEEKLKRRVQHLLFREVDGATRTGRQNDIRRDIRLHFEDVFMSYNESFRPYIMTAREHLSIPHHLIHFEGEAQRLLDFTFK